MFQGQMSSKKTNFYYLFPGGPHARRKKFVMHLTVGLIVGLIVAGILAATVYAMQR